MAARLTDGFGHYFRPDPGRVRDAFEKGIIVLDTNVLLNVLRYSPAARTELLEVLASIADRCFVPHQVAVEYNRNRVRVVADRHKELEDAASEIGSIRSKVRTVVNNLSNRRTLSISDIEQLEKSVSDFFAALEEAQNEAAEKYDLSPDEMVGKKDLWTVRLEDILQGLVGDKPEDEVLAKDLIEGERRKSEKLAPGFKDDKPGDYLWWAEALRHPDLKGRALVVVSDDAAKGDWRFEERGFALGPHPILIDDVSRSGGADLVLLTTRDLLKLVGELNPDKVSEETLEESEKVLAARQSSWTFDAFERLLAILDAEGYADRAVAIVTAASQDGFVDRDEIYRIIGSDEESRSLRHFATPVQRVMKTLIAEGNLPPHAPDALRAEYDGPGKTIGYSTPTEFVEFQGRRAQG